MTCCKSKTPLQCQPCRSYRCAGSAGDRHAAYLPGEATKFSQYLLDSDKRYRVVARTGQRTDTSDADGQIVQERPVTFTPEQLASALETFRGDIQQIPSMYSALKYQGKSCTSTRVRVLRSRVNPDRLPCTNCCLFATKVMNWSWKSIAPKARTFARLLTIWARSSDAART